MRDFTGLLTLIGSDAVDNSIGRITVDPVSYMMSVVSSFGLIGLARNLLKQAIGVYNCETLGFDTRGIISTYKNPFNNNFYNLRGVIRARELTKDTLISLPGSVRTYFLCLRGVRAWKDKVVDYADIKVDIRVIYLKLGALAIATAILSASRLLAVFRVTDRTGFSAIMTYINAVLLALFGFSVWAKYINTIFDGEDKNSIIWLVTTTRDSYNSERTTHYTVLKGFKPLNKVEKANKLHWSIRILAGLAMITTVISYTAILSDLRNAKPIDIIIWLVLECTLCLLRMLVWASPRMKALLAPTSGCPIQYVDRSDEKVWKRKSWFTTAPNKQWSLFSGMSTGKDIIRSHITLCPNKNSIWMNDVLLRLMQAGLVKDIGPDYVSLLLMSSIAGRCKFIRDYDLDTVERDILEQCTNNLLVMNNIGLGKFGIPEWALGWDNTAIGHYPDHYGYDMWIVVQIPGEPYDLNFRIPRPTRKFEAIGYSWIKKQRFKIHIEAIASPEGINSIKIGKPQPDEIRNRFTLTTTLIKAEMSGALNYADSVA